MPVLAHVPNGKVTALWGTAVLVAPDGTERPLKVGDVVHQGDRIVTSQDGIVQISPDAEQPTVAATEAAVPASAPAATVIAQGEEPLEFEAPAAGLAGGDGSMTPGLRVERVAESVTPAALDTTGAAPGVLDAVAAADAAEPALQPAQQVANAAPTAASASVTTAEDTPVSGVVVATDSNGDALSYAVGQAPANGSVTVDAAGRWTYVPAADYNGPDRFTLTVSDGRGGSTTATIDVAITPVADRPEGADAARTLAEDTTYTVSAADFGFSDADAGDTLAAVRIDTLPSAGTLLLGGVAVAAGTLVPVADLNAGRLVFQPAADGNGSPYGSFTFSVQDSSGSFDATPNTFTLNVTPGNDAPVISDPGADPATGNYSVTTPEDTPVSGRVIGADVDGDTLTYTKGSDPAHGTVSVGTDGRWTYTPSANYNGPDSFTVVVSDGNGGTVTSTVNVGITPANDLPDSANVARTIAEDSSYTVTAADFAFTDADAGSSLAAVRIDALPSAGTLLLNGTAVTADTVVSLADITAGNLVMQPAANANGAPYGAFTFSVQDNAGGFDATPNTFTLNVTPANDAPTAGNVTVTTPEDTPVSGRVTGSDVDGDGLTYTKGSDPAHGTVTVDTDGRWTYTPSANYNGPDSFTVVVSDGNGGTVTSTVNVGVTPANDLPDSADVTRTVAEDTAYTVTAADFAFTDADAGSTLAAVRIDTLPTAGTLLLGGTAVTAGTVVSLADLTAGNLTFRPAADASGSPYGAFTFSVQDNAGGFDASPNTFTLNVTPANDAPVIADPGADPSTGNYNAFTPEDTPVSGRVIGADVDGDTLTYTKGSDPAHGTVTVGTDGRWTYTPAPDYTGADSFTVVVSDGKGGTVTSTVSIGVTGANDLPDSADVTRTTAEDTAYTVTAADFAFSDADAGNTLAAVRIDTLPSAGTLLLGGTAIAAGTVVSLGQITAGNLTFQPAANASGAPYGAFTFSVQDSAGGFDASPNTFTLNVTPVNDRPDSADVTRTVAEDSGYTVSAADFAFTDADAGSALAAVRIDSLPSAGTLLLGGNAVAAGTVVSLADITAGRLVLQPAADANGSPYAAFTFSVRDDAGAFDATPNTFTLNVTPANDAPTTGNVTVTTPEDTPVSGRVTGSDVDGDTLTYTKGSDPAHGTVTVGTDGRWTYTPSANYNGPDSFTVVVSDGNGGTVTSTVNVGITPANDLPDSANVARTIAEDSSHTVTAADFAFTDADAGSSLAAVRIDTLPTAGALLLGGTAVTAGTVVSLADITAGNLVMQPAANGNGAPYGSFTFSVRDNSGGFDASPNTFTLNVTPANDAPAVSDPGADPATGNYTVATPEDTPVSGQIRATDPDGDTLTYTLRDAPAHGTVTVGANGSWTYTPATDYTGADRFTVLVDDGQGGTATSTVFIGVTGANDLPDSADVARSTAEDTAYTLQPADFAFSDADAGSSLAAVRIDTLPAAGTLLFNGSPLAAGSVVSLAALAAGQVSFQPAAQASGSPYASFTFSVQDNAGGFDASPNTFTLNVTPANDAPVISDPGADPATGNYSVTTPEDTPVSGRVIGADVDGDTLTYAKGSDPAHGTVSVGTDGRWTYTPSANYNGPDSFTVVVSDGNGGTVTSTVNVGITPANDLPDSANVARTIAEDSSYTVTAADFAFTDADAGSSLAAVRIDTLPTAGTLLLGGTAVTAGTVVSLADITAGNLVMQPAANANGAPYGSFTFSVQDNAGGFDASPNTFTLNVTPVNDLPNSANVTRTVAEDSSYTVTAGDFAFTDVDSGSSLAAVRIDTLPTAGTLLLGGTAITAGTVVSVADINAGRLVMQPAANANGAPYGSFTFSVQDNAGGFDASPNTFTLNVTPVNDLPSSANVTRTVAEDSTYTVGTSDFAFADVDSGSSLAAVRIDTLPTAGTLLLGGTAITAGTVVSVADINAGRLVMQPAANANGAPYGSFTFSVQDNAGGFDASPNTFTLNVTPANDAPTTSNVTVTTPEDTPVNGRVTGSDVDGDNLTYAKGSDPAHGTVTVGTDGTWTYTPNANYNGPDSFTVAISDGQGGTVTSTVSIGITPANDAPVISDPNANPATGNYSVTTPEDTPVSGRVIGADVDGDTLTYAKGSDPAHGTVSVGTDGRWTYTPSANYNGPDSFTVIVSDGNGGTVTSTINVGITPANDLPDSANVARTVAEDTGYTLGVADFAFTDADAASSLAAVRIDTLPTAGTLLLGGTAVTAGAVVSVADITAGRLVMQPAANATGTPYGSFTFSVQDNAGGFDASPNTFTLNVTAVNDAPTTSNVTVTTPEDTPVSGRVVGNDVDGDTLTYAKGSDPAHGTVTVGTDGRWTYTPAADYTGPDSFTVVVSDGRGGSTTSTVSIGVAGDNDLPDSANVTRTTAEDTAYNVTVGDFAFTDADAGNTLAAVRIDTLPSAGTLLLGGTAVTAGTVVSVADITAGRLVMQPAANANGAPYGSFTFSVQDNAGGFDASPNTFTLNVTAVNDLPNSANVTRTVAEDTPYTVSASDFAFTDVDSGSSLAAVRIDTLPTAGTLLLGGTAITAGTVVSVADITAGRLVMQPAANANGAPYGSFTFSVQDNSGGFDATPNTFTLNVTAVNDLPNSANVTRTVAEDSSYTVTAGDFAFTDVDSGSSLAAVRIDTLPTAGTLLLGGTAITAGTVVSVADINAGRLVMQPAANANGAPYGSFTFSVQDNAGSFDATPNTFTLNVTAVNDAPVATGGAVTGTEDTAFVFSWAQFNVSDVDSAASSLGVQITTLPADGALQLWNGTAWVAVAANQTVSQAAIAAGNLRFVPDAHESGANAFSTSGTGNLRTDYASFGYRPTDGSTTGAAATLRVDITPVADAPTLTTRNHTATLFTTSWETSDTGLTQAQLNPDTTSTANLSQTTLAGWTRVDTPDTYAGGTNFWELWSNGDTQQNAAGDQVAISADAGNGSNWLELNNANNAGARVQTLGIERTVTTTAGYVYDLSLDYAGRLGFGQNYTRIAVLVDGVEVASYAGTSSNSALNWETLHFSFVGTGAAQTIRIITDASEFNTNGRGAMIDDIRLVESQGALAGNAAGGSKTEIALQGYITTGLADTDGSEALTLTVSGLPTGATIVTAGAPSGLVVTNGSVTLSAADLASAKLQLGSSFTGDVALTVTATSTEPNGSTASTTQNLAFKVLVGAGDVGVEGSGTHTLEASTASLASANGLHGEFFGYNETATPGNGYNVQSGDGSVGNLDSLADITAIINTRAGTTLVGTAQSASAAASDAGWVADNIEYGVNPTVTANLGANATAAAGASITSGALWRFLGGNTSGSDAASLDATSSFGQTTDSILRMVGSAYFQAGSYDFQVRADDGFSLRIDGQVVLQFDGNQSATTRATTAPVTLSEGLHTVEILYWEQGQVAVLDMDYRPSGTTTWLDFSTDNLALFQSTNLPALTELQDIIEDPTTNGQYLVRTGQEAWGGATADTITGSAGRDIIHGGAGNDTLRGGTGVDRIEGGAGNDTLTGDAVGSPFADVFAWNLADAGTAGNGRAVDTITDFNTAARAAGGDVLDLRDLLQGENTAGGVGNLAQYLDIDTSGSDTVIRVSSGGGFASGTYAAGGEDQRIVLTGVNLRTDMGLAASATDNQVIQELLNRGKLLVDQT